MLIEFGGICFVLSLIVDSWLIWTHSKLIVVVDIWPHVYVLCIMLVLIIGLYVICNICSHKFCVSSFQVNILFQIHSIRFECYLISCFGCWSKLHLQHEFAKSVWWQYTDINGFTVLVPWQMFHAVVLCSVPLSNLFNWACRNKNNKHLFAIYFVLLLNII